jgi:hypothetical protein
MLGKRSQFIALGGLLAACVGAYGLWTQRTAAVAAYNPVVNPSDFVSQVDNKYFALKPGTTFTYQNKSGTERIEITVTNEKKKVIGVETTVVRAKEWKNGALFEETYDWYAQDKAGNVWYFGEAVDFYKNGKVVNHRGSWEAGVRGAKPGIVMKKEPKVGDQYRQEYFKGVAEDMGTVVATNKKVTVPFGTFENCLQIKDSSFLDITAEYKYYCPDIGFLALEEMIGRPAEAALVSVSRR